MNALSPYELMVFCSLDSLLAEGPLWHTERQSLFWIDILNCSLYEKNSYDRSSGYTNMWQLPEMASAMALDKNDSNLIWLVTDKSFGVFNLQNASYTPKVTLLLGDDMRSNDGGTDPFGNFWFGSMQRNPLECKGSIYKINSKLNLSCELSNIGIPNTLGWSQQGQKLYLSDSMLQKMFSYDCNAGALDQVSKKVFLDLSNTDATPDGGAMDVNGNLWNAQWGGFCVKCYSSSGNVLFKINLPVPQPTSCCFGGKNNETLFVTTACDGLSVEELARYPLSGSVFMIETGVAGLLRGGFSLDKLC